MKYFKEFLASFVKPWYVLVITGACLAVSFEILGTWAGFGTVFLSFLGVIISKMVKK